MSDFIKYQRTILAIVFVISGAAAVTMTVTLKNHTYIYGLMLGLAAGVIKFKLDVMQLVNLASQGEDAKPNGQVKNYFFTMSLTMGCMLGAVLLSDIFNPWATLGGLVLPRVVLIADGMIRPYAMSAQATVKSAEGEQVEG